MTTSVWDDEFERILRQSLSLLGTSEPLTPDANLGGLGLDSLESIQLLVGLEEAYGIAIPDEMLSQEMFETAGALWKVVQSLLGPVG
jgi:acyl carrier protein